MELVFAVVMLAGTDLEIGASFDREGGATSLGRVGAGKLAHTPTLLGTLRNARSQVKFDTWRNRVWRGRAGQAFEVGELDVEGGTTARFIRRGRSRAATGWPSCQDESRRAGMLAVLDQGLEPTRAR